MAKRKDGTILLRASAENESFSTLDVVAGLHGVCETLDDTVGSGSMDQNTIQRLSMAARVLSSIVNDRVEIPQPHNAGGRGLAPTGRLLSGRPFLGKAKGAGNPYTM